LIRERFKWSWFRYWYWLQTMESFWVKVWETASKLAWMCWKMHNKAAFKWRLAVGTMGPMSPSGGMA
jgi:hypothetical protein